MSFQIKICGVRTIDDVQACVDAGADCVGLNFYAKSVRYVSGAFAREVAQQFTNLDRAGVFVSESVDTIAQFGIDASLDWLQLHGDQTADECQSLARFAGQKRFPKLIRAVRLPTSALSVSEIEDHVAPWHQAGARILLDADAGPEFGGSGQRLDWDGIGRWAASTKVSDWILAGGLNPENVGEAIGRSGAKAVDVASGTERERGKKDAARIGQFVAAAKAALS